LDTRKKRNRQSNEQEEDEVDDGGNPEYFFGDVENPCPLGPIHPLKGKEPGTLQKPGYKGKPAGNVEKHERSGRTWCGKIAWSRSLSRPPQNRRLLSSRLMEGLHLNPEFSSCMERLCSSGTS